MNFSPDKHIELMRFGRQSGRCACCGRQLDINEYKTNNIGSWDTFYIDGNFNNTKLSNCAILCCCGQDSCHAILSKKPISRMRLKLTRKGF